MNEYDISSIFNEMQEYLIQSMTRNLALHEAWEAREGFNWEAWQTLQLEALEDFKRDNRKYVRKTYNTFKLQLDELLSLTNQSANARQESDILRAIQKGFSTRKPSKAVSAAFFRINERKLKAIFDATDNDLKKASNSMLRLASDEYRKIVYKAQVFANSGTMTVNQAIDMATKEFLSKGINCIEYKNGRRVGIDTYAEAVIRNANKKAYLVGEGTKREEWGVHTVLISRYGACSPTCLPWQGKVYIDDVYSGGTPEEAQATGYKKLSEAISGGLFHPNCKHIATTYFEGITTIPSATDVKKTRENSNLVATQRYNERQIRKYKRLEANSLDTNNQSKYKRKRLEWQARNRQLIKEHPEMHRAYSREKVRVDDIVQTLAQTSSNGALNGAWNNLNDPMYKNREKIANDLYSQIISRKKEFEIASVARNSNFSVEDVSRIYDHLFVKEHLFKDGKVHKFHPDYYMAHSWIRLREGKNIQKHDITMLFHELEEEKIMSSNFDVVYEDAHNKAQGKYNYQRELLEYLINHDV